MADIYVTDASDNQIYTTVGYLKNSGSTFPVIATPSKVIKFTSGNPAGIELQQNTSTPTTPGTGKWGYLSGYVYLGDALQSGETVIASRGTTRIFESVSTLAGTSYFDVGQSDANYRTKQQKLNLYWVGAGEELRDVQISVEDFLGSEGSSTEHYSLAADNNGSPGTWVSTLTSSNIPDLSALKDGQRISFWIKCVKPQGSTTGIFSDINIKIQGTRYLYTRGSTLINSPTSTIELPYNHYYLGVYVTYQIVSGTPTGFRPPVIYWDSSTQKTYLKVGWASGTGSAYVHYVITPINHDQVTTTSFTNASEAGFNYLYDNVCTITTVVTTNTWANYYKPASGFYLNFNNTTSGYFLRLQYPNAQADGSYFGEVTFFGGVNNDSITLTDTQYCLLAPCIRRSGSNTVSNSYHPYIMSWGESAVCKRYSSANPISVAFRGFVAT